MTQSDKITVPKIIEMKEKGEKIACLTAYDCVTASLFDASGIEIIPIAPISKISDQSPEKVKK